ncbi:MAG: hypothetical protein QOE52_5457, partial [Mycobacterium sp.]|nr:hypothetical protein [Mycobacterium sp.]
MTRAGDDAERSDEKERRQMNTAAAHVAGKRSREAVA